MRKEKGFKAYQIHNAMMLHFNPKVDYDYFKYNGKTRVTMESFTSDKKRIIKYRGIEKRVGVENLELFFFATLHNEKTRFIKFVPQIWYKNYKNYLAIIDDFPNTFIEDVEAIINMGNYKNLFVGNENHLHPLLYTWYSRGMISDLTMIFIDLYIERFLDTSKSNDPLHWKKVIDDYKHVEGFYRRLVFNQHDKDEMIQLFNNELDKIKIKNI